MLIVGLTGGIGSGKSLVAELFSQLGIPVYNADVRAKSLMLGSEIRQRIIEVFGDEAYVEGNLNRAFLSEKVFKDSSLLKRLNSIVHPAVRADHKNWHSEQNAPYTIREAAILYESNSYKDCDKVIVVSAPVEIRIQRVIQRDNTSREKVLERMENQWTDDKKISLSNFVILNDGKEMLLPQVLEIHDLLIELSKNENP